MGRPTLPPTLAYWRSLLVKLSQLPVAVPNLLIMGSPIPRQISSPSSPTLKQFARENRQRVQRNREQAEHAAHTSCRTLNPRTRVNKGKKKGRGLVMPRSSLPLPVSWG